MAWGEDSHLQLNAIKMKEMVVDFRRNKTLVAPVVVNGETIDMVDSFKFLGTTMSSSLSWDDNCTALLKKAQQRFFFLRQLKKFGLLKEILFASVLPLHH